MKIDPEERCTWHDSMWVQCELKAGHPFNHSCRRQADAWMREHNNVVLPPERTWWTEVEEEAREAEACIGAGYTGEWRACVPQPEGGR